MLVAGIISSSEVWNNLLKAGIIELTKIDNFFFKRLLETLEISCCIFGTLSSLGGHNVKRLSLELSSLFWDIKMLCNALIFLEHIGLIQILKT